VTVAVKEPTRIVAEQTDSDTTAVLEPMPYRGMHRRNLDDNSEIEALERQRQAKQTMAPGQVEPTPEEVETDPNLTEPAQPGEDSLWKKRYGDLRRHMAVKEREFNEKIEQLEVQLREASEKALQLPTSEEDVKRWAEQYPDVAKIVEAIAMRKADERAKAIEMRLQEAEKRAKEAARREAEARLRERHPDLDKLRESAEFHAWAQKQSPLIQAALYRSPNWEDCAAAIDLFKSQTGWGQQKRGPGRPRKEEAEAAAQAVNVPSARTVPDPNGTAGKKVWRESEIRRLRPYEWEKFEKEIEAARREGRLIYDVSGAAA